MNKSLPWHLDSRLTEDRLNAIAHAFIEIFDSVAEQLNTKDDCNYTRGSTFFGRCRNRLISMCLSERYSWLKLTNGGMDLTCEVEGIPFIFFRDDPHNPQKKGFWRRNAADQLFACDENTPEIFRFIIELPVTENDPPEIYFIGYNSQELAITEWKYGEVPVLQSVDSDIPKPVVQSPAPIDVRREKTDKKDGTEDLQ